MGFRGEPIRLLVVPGLNDSGPEHWQSWLQRQFRSSRRVVQRDWARPDLDVWALGITDTLRAQASGPWVAVAHSFGCLALARHLASTTSTPIAAALLVAPAEPDKFGIAHRLPREGLGIPTVLVGSETDPWMRLDSARVWARRWGSRFINLGDAGHVNPASGHGPLLLARSLTLLLMQQLERSRRLQRAHVAELNFAV